MAREGGGTRTQVLCDTNVLVRFLTADSPHHSPAARRALEVAGRDRPGIVVTDVIVAEVAYVLTKTYGLTNRETADRMIALLSLPGVECSNATVLEDALTLWAVGRLDFADAYLAAVARTFEGTGVLSFDRDFDRIDGVDRVDPAGY